MASLNVEQAVRDALDELGRAFPSRREFKAALEQLIEDAEIRLEAVEDELAEEDDGG